MKATIRPYQPADLGRVLQLWERAGEVGDGPGGLTVDQAVDLIQSDSAFVLVAEIEGELVGMALGTTASAIGWVHRLAVITDSVNEAEVADGLLEELEARFAEAGARKVVTIVEDGNRAREHLDRRDYRVADGSLYMERQIPPALAVPTGLSEVWGRIINPGLWDELHGLEEAKEIIERRVILPLAEPELAARHSVSPPKAIVLFGPPGTGKTTFAKGIASRLGWPFVEIQPSELGGEGAENAGQLARPDVRSDPRAASAVVLRRRGRGPGVDPPRRAARQSERHERVPAADPAPARHDGAPARLCDQLRPHASTRPSCGRAASTSCSRSARRTVDAREAIWKRYADRDHRRAGRPRRAGRGERAVHARPTSSSRPARPPSGRSSASSSRGGGRAPRPRTS